MSYHNTQSKDKVWAAGDVVRMAPNTIIGFSDMVILGFNDEDYAQLARPYAYVSCAGTTGPTALVGVEKISMVSRTSLDLHYAKVGSGRSL